MKKIIIVLALVGALIIGAGSTDNYFEISKNLEIFSDLYKNINLYYVDDTKPGELMKNGIDAMLKSLDPYTVYFPESRIEDYRFATTGQYGGIGSLIRTIDKGSYISEPYEGFPAQKVGLIAGDQIIKIDGKNIQDKTQDEISEFLKGQAGTKVHLEILRTGESTPRAFEIERAEIKIPDVPYSGMLDDKTGYIKLSSFTATAGQEVKSAFVDLKKEGMSQLILDLRGNPGGLLREAINIVNFFVPKGTPIVSTRGKISEWDKSHQGLNEPLDKDMPVIILVDENSASASEIVSGALQDLDRGIVLGTRTFGKGLVQQTKDIPYGTKLKLTVAKYYIPSGRCIQKIDHSHKNGEGLPSEVPDSLIQKFHTKNGRTVLDGRGINPDVRVEPEILGKVIGAIAQKNLFFKYANEYFMSHPSIGPAEAFTLTDTEYENFVNYLHEYDISYTTDTEKLFEELESVAKEEKYYEDASSTFERLKLEIKPGKTNDLVKFKNQVKEILENEIVSRYYYQNGRVKQSLAKDPCIAEAKLVLNSDRYSKLLSN